MNRLLTKRGERAVALYGLGLAVGVAGWVAFMPPEAEPWQKVGLVFSFIFEGQLTASALDGKS